VRAEYCGQYILDIKRKIDFCCDNKSGEGITTNFKLRAKQV
jgi:hypothetical protein